LREITETICLIVTCRPCTEGRPSTGTGVARGVVVPSPTSPAPFQPQLKTAGGPGCTLCPAAVAAPAGAVVPATAAAATAAMVMTTCTPRRALPPSASIGSSLSVSCQRGNTDGLP
jgi:hypothetical protein